MLVYLFFNFVRIISSKKCQIFVNKLIVWEGNRGISFSCDNSDNLKILTRNLNLDRTLMALFFPTTILLHIEMSFEKLDERRK